MQKQRGFTLVELLIVIVVIAILASLAVVSYQGVQARATNVAYKSEVSDWLRALEVYRVNKGSYPDNPRVEYSCLSGDSLAASGRFGADVCMKAETWQVSRDTAMMDDIKEVTGVTPGQSHLPVFDYRNLNDEMEYYRGVLYLSRNGGHAVTYPLKGNGSDCIKGATYFTGADGFVACQIILDGDPYGGL